MLFLTGRPFHSVMILAYPLRRSLCSSLMGFACTSVSSNGGYNIGAWIKRLTERVLEYCVGADARREQLYHDELR